MKVPTLSLTVLAIASLGACNGADLANPAAVPPANAIRTVTGEPGVVPPGTSLVIRTNDTLSTLKAQRGTVYDASIAADVLDQQGTVLIPRDSPAELVVRSLSYLGPGGVGMTELTLALRAVSINGVRYPIATESGKPGAGGLGLGSKGVRWVGGSGEASEVLTRGHRIKVPVGTLLAFQIEDPIRLRGFRRTR